VQSSGLLKNESGGLQPTASERLVWNAKIVSELGSKMPAAWERCSQNGSFALKLESETRFGAVWGKFVMVV